jgi:hypothetical protein
VLRQDGAVPQRSRRSSLARLDALLRFFDGDHLVVVPVEAVPCVVDLGVVHCHGVLVPLEPAGHPVRRQKRVEHNACGRFWGRLAPACDRGHTHPVGPRANGEVYEYLVGSPAFKAGDASDPRMAGSIPVHLRHTQNLFR